MFTYHLLCGLFLVFSVSLTEGVKCYHCYESFNKSLSVTNFNGGDFDEKFVRCNKNMNLWNSWECPSKWPVCIVMTGTVKNHQEIIRTCAEQDFCSKYTPPPEVQVNNCRECNTTLCNDFPSLPDPPVEPDPLFVFNININLNMKKYSMAGNRESEKEPRL